LAGGASVEAQKCSKRKLENSFWQPGEPILRPWGSLEIIFLEKERFSHCDAQESAGGCLKDRRKESAILTLDHGFKWWCEHITN
jgi:hypothetical protein